MQSRQYILHSLLCAVAWSLHWPKKLVCNRGRSHSGHLLSSSSFPPPPPQSWSVVKPPFIENIKIKIKISSIKKKFWKIKQNTPWIKTEIEKQSEEKTRLVMIMIGLNKRKWLTMSCLIEKFELAPSKKKKKMLWTVGRKEKRVGNANATAAAAFVLIFFSFFLRLSFFFFACFLVVGRSAPTQEKSANRTCLRTHTQT